MYKYKAIAQKIKDNFPEQKEWKKVSVALHSSAFISEIDSDFERFCQKVYELSTFFLDEKIPLNVETSTDFLYALYEQDNNILDREAETIYEQIIEHYRADIKV